MDQNTFYQYVKDHISEYLSNMVKIKEIRLREVAKNNTIQVGLLIVPEFEQYFSISPLIYLNSFYQLYQDKEKDLDETVKEVADCYLQYIDLAPVFATEDIMNYEVVKDYIYPKIISREGNEAFLRDKVFRPLEDLAILYYINITELNKTDPSSGLETITFQTDLASRYGISEQELYEQAMKNQFEKGYQIYTMNEIIKDLYRSAQVEGMPIPEEMIEGDVDEIPTWVITNKERMFGAAAMCNPKMLQRIAEELHQEEFYILPSSIHEMIVLPTDKEPGLLKEIVQQVNATEVQPEDRLSDNLYIYDARTQELNLWSPDKEEDLG